MPTRTVSPRGLPSASDPAPRRTSSSCGPRRPVAAGAVAGVVRVRRRHPGPDAGGELAAGRRTGVGGSSGRAGAARRRRSQDASLTMEDVDEPRLTVSGAARRLGIAPATLRTWDRRYGVGPAEHTRGRHRTYSAADMARLEVMQHALVKGASPPRRRATPERRSRPAAGASRHRNEPGRPRLVRSAAGEPTGRPIPVPGIDVIASLGAVDRQGHGLAAPTDGAALAAVRTGRSGGGLRMPASARPRAGSPAPPWRWIRRRSGGSSRSRSTAAAWP